MLVTAKIEVSAIGLLFVFVWIVNVITATSTSGCGIVNITFELTHEGVSGTLKFTPNQHLINNQSYSCRWMFLHRNGTYETLQSQDLFTELKPLILQTIEPQDFGEYMSECWLPGSPVIRSNKVSIDATSIESVSATHVTSAPETDDEGDVGSYDSDNKQPPTTTTVASSSTTTVVISIVTLCTVLFITSGIAVAIKLHQRRRLAEHKGKKHTHRTDTQQLIRSTNASLRITEHCNVNTVAIQQNMSVNNGNCTEDNTHFKHPHKVYKNIETVMSVSEYAVIDSVSELGTPSLVNNKVNTATNAAESIEICKEYAKVLPRSQRAPNPQHEANIITTESTIDMLNMIGQVTKFRKFDTPDSLPHADRSKQCDPNPCTLTAGNGLRLYCITGGHVEMVQEIPFPIENVVTCRDREAQSNKHVLSRCLSVSEGSGLDYLNGHKNPVFVHCNKERTDDLVYVDVDHGERVVDLANQYDLAINLPRDPPCTYSTIDFDKKAFIAPIRRAPSSWYKRKRKPTGQS